jgi:hypothetical protein
MLITTCANRMLDFEVSEETCLNDIRRVVRKVFQLPLGDDRLNIQMTYLGRGEMIYWDLLGLEYSVSI